jgi:P-type Ca2+ transporter type 2C
MQQWWHQNIDSIVEHFSTDLDTGLSEQQVQEQQARVGLNELKQAEAHSPLKLFAQQFQGFVVYVLIGAAVVSALVGEGIDACIIGAIVVLNAILGFVQEFRAEKSLAALKKLASPNSQVLRGGNHQEIPSAQLVPGDVIELEAGDNVPADSRITWVSSGFAVQEASLTGESLAVNKDVEPLDAEVPLADRVNMVFMGTSITNGRARAIVAETGMSTELGKIADMMADIEDEMTPLQRKLEEFGKAIVVVCLILVSLIFVMGLLHGGELKEIFLTAVSLAVAAIPEGLPAVVTIALALGVQRMVKRNGLIRKLPSVETLGCTTVICSDKTGTLTRNEMTVQKIFAGLQWFDVTGTGYEPTGEFTLGGDTVSGADHPELAMTLKTGVLCNGARLVEKEEGGYGIIGDPTEGCLLTAGAKADLSRESLEPKNPVVDEIPFDSERRKMTVVCRSEGSLVAYVKGAPDEVLKDCTHFQEAGQVKPLSDQVKTTLMDANSELADQAMRVLAGAYRVLDEGMSEFEVDTVEKELIFVGLFGLMDPPREEVKLAIQECASAGIRPVMITGDHKKTAVAIAKKLGFFDAESLALSGTEVDQLSEEALRDKVEQIAVYARVSPEHKLRIVRAWRDRGQIVAMTGDGVNDAPALKEADIGVAMGITGTDVTKEVADMVITDDNYTSIVAAVEEGRGVYDNIRKFVHYLLSCNAGEILLMLVSSLFGMPAPLLAVHILWINLVTDGLPALALGVERIDPGLMTRPPRPTDESVVTRNGGLVMLAQAVLMAACALGAYIFARHHYGDLDPEIMLRRSRTVAFVVLACSQLFHSFNCRNLRESLFKIGPFGNMKLVAAVSISFGVQVAVVHIPLMQGWFRTEALTATEWVWVLLVSSIPLWGVELGKAVMKWTRKA